MIISHKYKIVFIHIPKNAGTFITNILKQIDDNLSIINGHVSFNELLKMDIYLKINKYYFFAVVREPIEMFFSFYNYILKCKEHYLHNYVKENHNLLTFTQFVVNIKQHYTGNTYYIKKNDEINYDIKLLFFNNIQQELIIFFSNIIKDKEIIDKIKSLLNIKINETKYEKNDEDLKLIYNIFMGDKYFKNEIDFYNSLLI
jgi:hypothetical protein